MNCPKCGTIIENGAMRCCSCGKSITEEVKAIDLSPVPDIDESSNIKKKDSRTIFKKLLMGILLIFLLFIANFVTVVIKDSVFGKKTENNKSERVVDYSAISYEMRKYAGLSIYLPFPLIQKEILLEDNIESRSEERSVYNGKLGDKLQISIAYVKYAKGIQVELDEMADLQASEMSKNKAIISVKREDEDVLISGVKCKKVILDVDTKNGPIKVMYNIIKSGQKFWAILIIFDGNNKHHIDIVKRAIDSLSLK